ncbi:hypothetical protein BJV82DRAFT_617292 [Fennellomyces sp. T-0311]|nr:hypothetical protein BJV82DRAFT_617292 [Fennellomyces sp. T-0311]
MSALPPPAPQPQPFMTSSLYNGLLNGNGGDYPGEDISTIFVVGFPDDMQEREFQNMFIFASGFEAATLKIPSKDLDDDLPSASSNGRKQIIGFAKFRTRLEALEARDILSGRKVDAEKGSVLKAEMAKKNLHTKRGLSSEQQKHNAGAAVGGIMPVPTQSYPQQKRYPSTPYEAFYSVPLAVTSPEHHPLDFSFPEHRPSLTERSGSMGDIYTTNNRPSLFGHRYSLFDMDSEGLTKSQQGLSSVLEEAYQQQPSPPLPQPSLSASSHHPDLSAALNARLNGLSINTSSSAVSNGGLPSPPGVTSPNYRSLFGAIGTMDQNNPPCNTLYVGNLPPNTNEDELRAMFVKCVGFKRLSFKSKANSGPMCFVEFDDVPCATQALHELYGNPLSNSVKGGIRLSFSKNPLGVRQPSFPGTYRRESLSMFDSQ